MRRTWSARRGWRPPARVWTGVLLTGLLLVSACGTQTGAGPGASPGRESEPATGGVAGFPVCADVPQIRADGSRYWDEPVYGNADELVQEVREWVVGQPGFVELGLDRERNGWVTVWVKDADVEALSEQVAERWPGEGIVVVEVPWTVGELQSLATEVTAALDQAGVRTAGTALMPHHGVAEIGLGVITPEAEEVLAQFAGRPLCVEGIPADEAPEEKAQPLAGEGWRLLGEDETGEANRTGVATTDAQLAQLWALAGLGGEPSTVEWDSEIAVWFGAVYGSGCPVRMDGVVVEGDLLHANLVVPNAVYGCNDDANPHAFVVAVERDLLPEGPFRVQLEDRDPYPGAPEERTVVDVDLSAPGSTATDEQLHLDPSLVIPAEPPLVTDGDALHADEAVRYVYRHDSGCEVPTLGPLDGSVWRLADREAPWDVEDGEELTLYPLGGDGSQIIASTQQMDWIFTRLPEGKPCPGSPGGDFEVRRIAPGESWDQAVQPLVVRVSNQSFDDPNVALSATLDEVALFDQVFAVEGQHTVTLFGVEVAPGSHTLRVVSDSGAQAEQTFDLPAGEQRWLVVNYSYFDPDTEGESWGGEQEPGPSIDMSVSEEPVYIS